MTIGQGPPLDEKAERQHAPGAPAIAPQHQKARFQLDVAVVEDLDFQRHGFPPNRRISGFRVCRRASPCRRKWRRGPRPGTRPSRPHRRRPGRHSSSRVSQSESWSRTGSARRRTSRPSRRRHRRYAPGRCDAGMCRAPRALTRRWAARRVSACPRARRRGPRSTGPRACRRAGERRSLSGHAAASLAAPSIWGANTCRSKDQPIVRERGDVASEILGSSQRSARAAKRYIGFSCQCSCMRTPRTNG